MLLHYLNGHADRDFLQQNLSWVQSLKSTSFFWGIEEILSETQHADCWILKQESSVIGFVLVRDGLDQREITSLALNPQYLGQGHMTRLLRTVLDASQKPTLLEVHESNHQARRLYIRLGGKQIGRRPSYYRDGSAALIFQF